MPEVRIDDLLTNVAVDPHGHLDAERVAAYVRDVDALPPVVVFAAATVGARQHRVSVEQARAAIERRSGRGG